MYAAELAEKAARDAANAQKCAHDARASSTPANRQWNISLAETFALRASQYAHAAAQQARREAATW